MEVNQIGRFDDSEAGRLTDREIELQSAAEIAVLRNGCRVKSRGRSELLQEVSFNRANSPENRWLILLFWTAIDSALRWPTRITRRLPRVTPV